MRNLTLSLLATGLVLALTGSVFAENEKIDATKLPKAVVDNLKTKFPGGQFKEACKYTHNGKTCYEVEFKVDGQEYDAIFLEDGALKEYCREIKVKELPQAVSQAVEAKYPKCSIKEADEHFEGTTQGYKLEVKTDDGKKLCVKTDATGKILEAKDEEQVKREKGK